MAEGAVWALAAIAAAGAVDQHQTAKRQEKAAEEQHEAEVAIESESAARQRRSAASEALVARRQIEAQAGAAGFSGTAVEAGKSGVTNQLTQSLADLNFATASSSVVREKSMDVFKAGVPSLGSTLLQAGSGIATSAMASYAGAKASKSLNTPETT
jgi:hypothetical protein